MRNDVKGAKTMQDHTSAAVEAAKLAPAGVYAGVYFGGISIQDWVAILTGLYIAAQLFVLVRNEVRKCRSKPD
jgi:hypothetical protein